MLNSNSMTSESNACAGFFQEQAINQYIQRMDSNATSAASIPSSSCSSSNSGSSVDSYNDNIGNGTTLSSDNHRSSGSSKSSTSSGSSGNNANNNNNNGWNDMPQQQQQQHQQKHQQHQHQQQQHDVHHRQQQPHQQQHQQHNQHHHHHQQHQHQSQHHQQHAAHQQSQQQQTQEVQPNSHHNAHISPPSNSLIVTNSHTNPHSIFGTGNYHYKTNNSWSIPALSCYQRLYSDSNYQRNFASAESAANNSLSHTSSSSNNTNNNNASHNNSTRNHNPSNSISSNNYPSVQHVANAVAAAVIANEQHQQQLNNLKPRLQASSLGKSSSNKEICGDDKYKEEGDLWNVEAQTAFLGPNLWDKTLPYDADLKVTQYADLDEFLSENNIPDGLPGTHLGHSGGLGHRSDSLGHAAGLSLGLGHITTKRERSPSPSDCISPDTLNPPSPAESTFSFASSGRDFDPRTRAFSDEELKPQPMIKKSRKQFVPDELKDDKYWARRRKNNIAAKRSRDARRQKENQIAMRARYLEKENATLHQEVEQLKQENMDLRARLNKFQDV